MQAMLNRIILFGADLNRLKIFYQQHFNFTLVEEIDGQWIVLNAGQMEVALHKIGDAYLPKDGKPFRAQSNTKLVFGINGDLAAFRKGLLDKGVTVKEVKSFGDTGLLFCDGEDGEGNVFQLVEKRI
jgi:catechol 2,3-dioxygenase-like lactoylglutathione lyase family enzyme